MKQLLASLFLAFVLSSYSSAASPVLRPDIAKDAEIVSARGDSWVMFIMRDEWNTAVAQQSLTSGDQLKTGAYGKLDILFLDGTQIKVHSKTQLLIKEARRPNEKRGTVLGLRAGEVWSRAKASPEGLRIETPSATAAIRGTDWDILVDDKGASYLTVLKGSIELYNDQGKVIVDAGEQAMAEVGKAPVKTFLVRPRDRVQWIISYPIDIADAVSFQAYRRPEALGTIPDAREKAIASEAKLTLAELLYDVKERDESMKIVNEALASEPRNSRALVLKGYLHLGRGETDPAEESFRKALENPTQRTMVLGNLGLAGVHLQKGKVEKADNIIEGLNTKDALPEVGVVLAQFRAFQGNFSEAIRVSATYGERFPKDERFQVMIADFSTTLDEPEKAEASIKSAFSINPDSSMAWTIAGRQQYLNGNSKEAERSFRRAIEIDPANTLAMSEIGKLLLEKGHYEESDEKLSSAIEKDPGVSSYWSRRGMLMNWVENMPSALADLGRATELNASDYQSFNGLGVIALKEGRTKEAAEYFQKAGVMEPGYAEPHIFLAIAYYQLEDVDRALEELRIAVALDPKDPVPHIIANIIYQDTYQPMLAVQEASVALELLPNLKSVNPVEANERGLSNLGSALLGLGLREWATSYAEESFNPFDASGYYFVSKKFEDNPFVYFSENVQGFLIDPISIGRYNRYDEIVPKPHNLLTLSTTLGSEDGAFSRREKISFQGYARYPVEMKYILDFENLDNKGFRENGYLRQNILTYALSMKPDYRHGFIIFGSFDEKKYGDPGPVDASSEPNDTNRSKGILFNAGYNQRVGPKNNLLFNFHYSRTELTYNNPDPFGKNLTGAQMSVINAYGLDTARDMFNQGMYDLSGIFGFPTYAFDPTNSLSLTVPPLSALPRSIDTNRTRSSSGDRQAFGYQFKHLFAIGDSHQAAYGVEYARISFPLTSEFSDVFNGPAVFWLYPGPSGVIPDLSYGKQRFKLNADSESFIGYVTDRWKPTESLLIDVGLFYETFRDERNSSHELYPRAGFAWKLTGSHILRAAYQKRLLEAYDVTLSPVTTAGLFFDWQAIFPGTHVTDYQAALESRWNGSLFTAVAIERRDLSYPVTYSGATRHNRTDIFSAAINAIITNRIGLFARYKYADSTNLDGINKGKNLPFVPAHSAAAGLTWVSPRYVRAALTTTYIADLYGDEENTYKMPSYWTTDLSVKWEPFKKHVLVGLNINNIFDRRYETEMKYPASGRSAFLTLEYRF